MGISVSQLNEENSRGRPRIANVERQAALAQYAEQTIGKDELLAQAGRGTDQSAIRTSGGMDYSLRAVGIGKELARQELSAPPKAELEVVEAPGVHRARRDARLRDVGPEDERVARVQLHGVLLVPGRIDAVVVEAPEALFAVHVLGFDIVRRAALLGHGLLV